MDAKITKQRLSNLLSYDWLKILVVIAAAVGVLALLFTMTATRPTNAQTFSVYSYTDVQMGRDKGTLNDTLKEKNVFSYDILEINSESFFSNDYASQAFSARRAAGEGTVIFTSSVDGEGKASNMSGLYSLTIDNIYSGEAISRGCYNPQYFLETEIKEYLVEYFGQDLQGDLNKEAARIRFMDRNGRDKRFRSQESKERGVQQEEQRLEKLREDYLAMKTAFEEGKLFYTAVNAETAETPTYRWGESCPEGFYPAAVNVSALPKIIDLFYCIDAEGKATNETLQMVIFRNQSDAAYDLNYETASFLSYLVEKYA